MVSRQSYKARSFIGDVDVALFLFWNNTFYLNMRKIQPYNLEGQLFGMSIVINFVSY